MKPSVVSDATTRTNMRDKSEIVGKAAQVKVAMLSRVSQISELLSITAKARAGMAPDVKEDRLETIAIQIENLSKKQLNDGMVLASLRWVLGLTEDVDASNLQLDK